MELEGLEVANSGPGWSSEVFLFGVSCLTSCSTTVVRSPGWPCPPVKVFKTLCESLAWRCSVGMFGKMLSVLHGMEEEGSVCDTERRSGLLEEKVRK